MVHSAKLASARGHMSRLDAQSSVVTVDGRATSIAVVLVLKSSGVQLGEKLLRDLRSSFVDDTSFVHSVRGFLHQYMDHDLYIYLRAVFTTLQDPTADFPAATSNVVDTYGSPLCQDFSCIFIHLDGDLAALASDPSVTTSPGCLSPGTAPPPS